VSEFRVEKRRAAAELTLTTGDKLRGWFFLAASSATHVGPERVADLLNTESGFFPFELAGANGTGARTALCNRAHVVCVKLTDSGAEVKLDPAYEIATSRQISMRLSNGQTIAGTVRVYRPLGRDRLSDYARSGENFRYIETRDATFIVNSTHVVELRELNEA
jgi:hypothetical protein